jgi:uncharacterized RDD family membrane protein YckC
MRSAGGHGTPTELPLASLSRRLAALIYEALLLFAVLAVAALPFAMFTRAADAIVARPLLQIYLVAVAATYFVWQWRRGGQTLPMKTWRLRVVTRAGSALSLRQALSRFVLAAAGCLAGGGGFVWALVDREGQFLHDRLAGTQIIKDEGGRMT